MIRFLWWLIWPGRRYTYIGLAEVPTEVLMAEVIRRNNPSISRRSLSISRRSLPMPLYRQPWVQHEWTDPDTHAYIGDGTMGCVVCQAPMNAHPSPEEDDES